MAAVAGERQAHIAPIAFLSPSVTGLLSRALARSPPRNANRMEARSSAIIAAPTPVTGEASRLPAHSGRSFGVQQRNHACASNPDRQQIRQPCGLIAPANLLI